MIQTLANVIDSLTYVNYRHNRRISPDISPERWAKIFGPGASAMEARYQQENQEQSR